LRLLNDELDRLPDGADLPGQVAFKLYDTYGFPLDLTQDVLREKARAVDVQGFDAAMEEQKTKARAAWSGAGGTADAAIWFGLAEAHGTTEFLGYELEAAEGQINALVRDGAEIGSAETGTSVQIVVNQSPFYAESGGQVGDHGFIRTQTGVRGHRHSQDGGRVHPCCHRDRRHHPARPTGQVGSVAQPPFADSRQPFSNPPLA
jgi:alanyl-tRNA synthetase